jgi:tetratricopeptide (TPR) repeat protein
LLVLVSPFSYDTGYARHSAAALALAEAAGQRGDRRTQARAWLAYSAALLAAAGPVRAERHTRLAVQGFRETGDAVFLRHALNQLGVIAQFLHRYDEAVEYFDQSIELAREQGHRSGEATITANAALARVRSGRSAEAITACAQALEAFRALGDHSGAAFALYVQGLALHELRRHQEAQARFTECLELCETAGIRDRAAHARYRLADTLCALGRHQEAVAHAAEAVSRCERIGSARDQAHALTVLGRARAGLGQPHAARGDLEHAHAIYLRLGLPEAATTERLLAGLAPVAPVT